MTVQSSTCVWVECDNPHCDSEKGWPEDVGNNRANGHRMRVLEDQMMVRLGGHKTGRVLDCRTWDDYPGSAA